MKQLNSHTNDIDCYSTTIYSFTTIILLLWKLWKNKHSFIIVFPHMCFMNVNFQVRRWWMHRMLDLFRMNVTHNTNQLCKFANTLLLPQYSVRGVDSIQKCLTTTAYQYIIRIRLTECPPIVVCQSFAGVCIQIKNATRQNMNKLRREFIC